MAPTDQRAGVRPISFLLDDCGSISAPVLLKIRPEDLARQEPSRSTVHQTLGRSPKPSGWLDNFGEGLPSCTISGHTGWRAVGYSAEDGVAAFERLNKLVQHKYHAAKQAAIDSGRDPAGVKLLFVDTLDNFAWSVTPTQFVLRRSRSRPLLMQYNIGLQAVSTSVDLSVLYQPDLGSIPAGLRALDAAVSSIEEMTNGIIDVINRAVGTVNGVINNVGAYVHAFCGLATRVMRAAYGVITSVTNGFTSVTNSVIGIAKDIAGVGTAMFRTFSAIVNLPSAIRAQINRMGKAFNEVECIFSNALRPRKVYEDYTGLYGASNCSSTTGGRPISNYTNANAFAAMQSSTAPIAMSSAAMSSVNAIKNSDPVLAPMPAQEVARHTANILDGTSIA